MTILGEEEVKGQSLANFRYLVTASLENVAMVKLNMAVFSPRISSQPSTGSIERANSSLLLASMALEIIHCHFTGFNL